MRLNGRQKLRTDRLKNSAMITKIRIKLIIFSSSLIILQVVFRAE